MHRVNDDEIEGETLEFQSEERLPEKGEEREEREVERKTVRKRKKKKT